MSKVSIVIPNWNGREKLEKNLPAVFEVVGVGEVIIVDDASEDSSVNFIQSTYPKIKLFVQLKNQGFSTTVNKGVSEAKEEFIFLLNSDAIPSRDSLKSALSFFSDEKVFSVSCNTGGSWSWAYFTDGYFWHYMAPKVSESHQTLWSSGGSAIFRKSVWEELGGLDENFNRFYEEDMDLGYRATKRGYLNIWDPNSLVEHSKQKGVIQENFTPKEVAQVAQRNQLLFIWKNIHDKKMIVRHIVALFRNLITHPRYVGVFLSAAAKLPSILSERRVEIENAKLTDQEILSKFSYNNR